MKQKNTPLNHPLFSIATLALGIHLALSTAVVAQPNPIKIDQFGYLPQAQKIAIISHPQQGFNADSPFTPGTQYEVRHAQDDSVAFSADIHAFQAGVVDASSGDQTWQFNFSSLTTAGEYYIYDSTTNTRSENFRVAEDVYHDVLKHAMRSFFYQRVNHEKQPPYADARWTDSSSHAEDAGATLINPSDPSSRDLSTVRDLSGGWYDAGDFNKYVNSADGALHELLFAYEENPSVWTDDYNIPESGNQIPDILDEIKWELDWLLKMQNADGSVLHKMSSIWHNAGSPPSTDDSPRRYAPATASATISAAGALAHAARVFASVNDSALQAYAGTLESAALAAWNWLDTHPAHIPSNYDNQGFYTAQMEDCTWDNDCNTPQQGNRVAAAIYLFALTDNASFNTYVKNNAPVYMALLQDNGEAYLRDDGRHVEFQNALLYYTQLNQADAALVTSIKDNYSNAMSMPMAWVPFAPLARFQEQADPYRAYLEDYHWGSNRAKSNAGNMMLSALQYQTSTDNQADYYNGGAGYLHYMHGVNPLGISYLSNMSEQGADHSVSEMYHLWFLNGSQWDSTVNTDGPAPGYLVGGANAHYGSDGGSYADNVYINQHIQTSHLLKNQPAQKSFWSWNTGAEQAWEVTENSITYQATYIRLLSKFLVNNALGQVVEVPETNEEPPIPQDPLDVTLDAVLEIDAQWDGGYCATAKLSSDKNINDWSADLTLNGGVIFSDISPANTTTNPDGSIKVTPLSWNHLRFAGEMAWFDYCATGEPTATLSHAWGHQFLWSEQQQFGSLQVERSFSGVWSDSYCMNINITNISSQSQTWSEVSINLPDSNITDAWSADVVQQGELVTFTPHSWNAYLTPGDSADISYCASGINNVSLSSASVE